MFRRPTILCRRSFGNEHEFVVALPDGSGPEAAERFRMAADVESFRRLSGGRIAFRMARGPALTNLIKEAFSGTIGGFPVVRALMDPESFPGEENGLELDDVPSAGDPGAAQVSAPARRISLAAVAAVGVAFLLGMGSGGFIGREDAPAARPEKKAVPAPALSPENVAVDLGTFLMARGPAAAFRSGDGTLRYAVADGSLEGRLRPGMEVRVAPGVRPAFFTPVQELRDAEGAFVFHHPPALAEAPDLGQYTAELDSVLRADLVWVSASDSTASFYAVRAAWRAVGTRRVRLEGDLVQAEDGPRLLVGPVQVRLVEMDNFDLLNLSMLAPGVDRISVYGAITEETPWEILRLAPDHPAFEFRVDWIEPETPPVICRAEGI